MTAGRVLRRAPACGRQRACGERGFGCAATGIKGTSRLSRPASGCRHKTASQPRRPLSSITQPIGEEGEMNYAAGVLALLLLIYLVLTLIHPERFG
jgi:K+-transporting ATPase KdpF subunit